VEWRIQFVRRPVFPPVVNPRPPKSGTVYHGVDGIEQGFEYWMRSHGSAWRGRREGVQNARIGGGYVRERHNRPQSRKSRDTTWCSHSVSPLHANLPPYSDSR